MTNEKIAESLERLADLMEFQGANAFRLRAYRNGARTIRDLPDSIASLLAARADLTQFDGVGKSVAQKCKELVETGKLQQLEDILQQVPKTVLDLLRVPKLGPKKAAVLFNDLGIENLEQLKDACEAGQIRELPGFGVKTEQAILDGLELANAANERIYWSKADQFVQTLREYFADCKAVQKIEFAGSYRRGKETVGDLDILVVSKKVDQVMDHFANFPSFDSLIGRGPTKMAIRLDTGFQIDLRVVPAESFGAALQYFTGSKQHNVVIRSMAKQRGLKINEWGVYRLDGNDEKYVAGKTEREVYKTLDLPLFPPEIRESRFEFELAEQGKLPKLVTVDDIRGDLHMHTTETDGKASLEEMVAAAQARGLSYIAITDHSKRVTMANGLDGERLLAQWAEIDELNKQFDDDFWVFKGIECDILENGDMDLSDDILAQADWVIASIHYGQNQPRAEITRRILNAIENPNVNLIAHPTGRLLNRRKPYDVDLSAVYAAAVDHGTLMELNANPARLDLNDVECAIAKAKSIPIVINTDAHSIDRLNVMRYGIKQARRAGLTRKDVWNCQTLKQVKKQLLK